MGHSREGTRRSDRLPLAHQAIHRQGRGVSVRAPRAGHDGRRARAGDPLRRAGRRARPPRRAMLVRRVSGEAPPRRSRPARARPDRARRRHRSTQSHARVSRPLRARVRIPGDRQRRLRQHGEAVRRVRRAVRVLPLEPPLTPSAGMGLKHLGDIELPPHAGPGGFDHAAVHGGRGRLYVAHTANDALDVIDCARRTYTGSIRDLAGVAGALVSEEHDLVFTSNRSENTVAIFSPPQEQAVVKVEVGVRPNGLAYAPAHRLLLVANVGDPSMPQSFTVSMVDVAARRRIDDIPVPGRTRWAMFDHETDSFYVNIADPPQIVVIGATTRGRVTRAFTIPAAGPHGLDLDAASRRLFCAC